MTDHALASFEAKDGHGPVGGFHLGHYRQRQRSPLHEAVPYRVRRACRGAPRNTSIKLRKTTASGCGRRLPSTKRPEALPTPASPAWALGGPEH